MKRAALLLLALVGCAGDPFRAGELLEHDAGDPTDAAADVLEQRDAGAVDAAADVLEQRDTGAVDAAADVLEHDAPADAPTAYEKCQAEYLAACEANPSACSTLTLEQVCGDGGS